MMPEYILPYVLHLLAHFPDFPMDKEDNQRAKVIFEYVAYVALSGLGYGGRF